MSNYGMRNRFEYEGGGVDKPRLRPYLRFCGVIFLVALVGAGAFFSYKYQYAGIAKIENYVVSFKEFVHKKRTEATDLRQNKIVTAYQEKTEKLPQFEFYHLLPAMQVKPTFDEETKFVQVAAKKPSPVLAKTLKKPAIIISKAEELENELSKHLQTKYVVQLGVFRSHEAALRYQQSMRDAGVKVTLAKTNQGEKALYRIEQGPYFDKVKAQLAQQKLHEKGVNALVRKIG